MPFKHKLFTSCLAVLIALNVILYGNVGAIFIRAKAADNLIKWVDFEVTTTALNDALKLHNTLHEKGFLADFVDILAYLGAKYGGDFHNYRQKDLASLQAAIEEGQRFNELCAKLKSFSYYKQVYGAVLAEYVGDFQRVIAGQDGDPLRTEHGLKAFSPIAAGYGYSHNDDFGNSRTYGYSRPHLGNDLFAPVGTPIVAVESGTIETMGWNQYGGWRIGIRSFDKKRYYYYAHMRKGHPFKQGLNEGDTVRAGDVIGYVGMTGYSTKEDVNNMKVPHLHFGIQLIFDESQKDGNGEIWIDPYELVNLLSRNRASVAYNEETKEYERLYEYLDKRFAGYED